MNPQTNTFWNRLPEPVRRDPTKSAVLVGLMLVMTVVGFKQFSGRGGAAKAKAAPSSVVSTPGTSTPAKSGASTVSNNPQNDAGVHVAQWLGTPIKALDRNLFETKLEFFQRLDSQLNDTAAVLAEELFWEQLAKSLASQADQKKQKQIRSENLQLAASSLRLQTTIMGSAPRALIDGRMVRRGDLVESRALGLVMTFQVLQIEARSIVIEREGVKLELRMGVDKARLLQE